MSERPAREPGGRFLREGAAGLCLEFVNTVAWGGTAAPEERLAAPPDLLGWCVGSGILAAGDAAQLGARWEDRPAEALAFHGRALALREAIYRIFRSGITGDKVPADALRILNEALAEAPTRARIAWDGEHFGWLVGSERAAGWDVLAPIVWSAADLLSGARLYRVRECAHARCRWLFLDESRAGSRRWCSMEACGNRAKARRHYLRKKGRASVASPNALRGG